MLRESIGTLRFLGGKKAGGHQGSFHSFPIGSTAAACAAAFPSLVFSSSPLYNPRRCVASNSNSSSVSSTGAAAADSIDITPAIVGSLFVRDPYEHLPDLNRLVGSSDNGGDSSNPCGSKEPYLVVFDPSTGNPVGRTPNLGARWVRASIAYAAQAQPAWGSASALARSNLLLRWNAVVEERKEALASLITSETGKPVPESRQEVLYAASYIRWCAEEARRMNGLTIPSADGNKLQYTVKEPLGVCALITPFNLPLAMVARKAAAALAVGNACTVRPSEETPLSAVALAVAAREAGLPRGLFNVVPSCRQGGMMFGNEVCKSKDVDLVSFTGSTGVGMQLYRQCAGTVKRILLELGGNAPFVVFEDAPIKDAVLGLLAAKIRCAGQTCVSANRVYVHRSIFDDFAKQTTKLFSEQEVGSGRKHGVAVGPLINSASVKRVEEIVRDALEKGARLLLGGERAILPGELQNGSFYQVTVLDCREVAPDARVRHEELFAPVVCLFDFETEEEAAALANATDAGLAAYFYTQNATRLHRFARKIRCGMMGVNAGMISSCEVPFGGCKYSGFGREGSVFTLDDYSNIKFVAVNMM